MENNNNYFLRLLGFILIAAFLCSCTSSHTQQPASKEIKEKYHAAAIEAYLKTLTDNNLPGFSYLIAKDGLIIAKGGLGLANADIEAVNDTNTIFRAASLTKQFTAAAILKLADEHNLLLDDPLEKYFPELPNAQKITIRHLLTHTSGIWQQERDEDFPFPIEQEVPTEEHLSYIQNNKPYFEPGEMWRYSDNGYFILGLIVEKVTNAPLETYLKKEIFEPLGMKNSGLTGNTTHYKNSAQGYGITEGKPYKEKDTNMATYNGAAALYSTVDDLFIWTEALHGGKVISEQAYKEMISPYQFKNGFVPFVGYGFGLGIEDIAGQPTLGHPGQLYGFHADILRLPNDNLTYIFLSNVNNNQLKSGGRVSEKVIELLYKD